MNEIGATAAIGSPYAPAGVLRLARDPSTLPAPACSAAAHIRRRFRRRAPRHDGVLDRAPASADSLGASTRPYCSKPENLTTDLPGYRRGPPRPAPHFPGREN